MSAALRERAGRYLAQNKSRERDLRRLFTLRLAQVPRQGDVVKRRAHRAECSADEWRIAEDLAGDEWRLVTVAAQEMSSDVSAEVAHEQVLRKWTALARWLEERREFLTWKADVEQARASYDEAPQAEKPTALLTGRKLFIARQWLASHGGDLGPEDRAFIQASAKADDELRERAAEQERQRRRLKRGFVAASFVFLLVILALVVQRNHESWVATRPWASLSSIPENQINELRGKPASIGRKEPGLESLRFDISLPKSEISRYHLLISPDHKAFDQRSLYGTSINAEPLVYGSSKNLEDGDVIALSGMYAFRFFRINWQWWHYFSDLLPGSADDRLNAVDFARWYGNQDARSPWGVLIDGRTRIAHLLSQESHLMTLGEDDTLTIDGISSNPQSDASIPKPLVMALNYKRQSEATPVNCEEFVSGRYLAVKDSGSPCSEAIYPFSFKILEGGLIAHVKDDDRFYGQYSLPLQKTIIGLLKTACEKDKDCGFPAHHFMFEIPERARFFQVVLFPDQYNGSSDPERPDEARD